MNIMNKKNIVSLAIDPDIQEKIKKVAVRKELSVSKVIRDLAEKFLNEDENFDMIVLKIPKEIRKNHEELKTWMDIKTAAIYSALVK